MRNEIVEGIFKTKQTRTSREWNVSSS